VNAIPDTNVLVRIIVRDDPRQAKAALDLLEKAEKITVSLPALCETVWVLQSTYHLNSLQIAESLETLLRARNVVTNRPAVELGLRILRTGGDFADAIIAYEGIWLGGDVFTSFDKKAVKLLAKQGQQTKLLS